MAISKEHFSQRLLEILPGFFSWNLIFFPYWGILVIPNAVAYFVLAFNIYWFYQSFQIAATSFLSHLKIQASVNYDWLGDVKNFPDYQKVRQAIIITTYREPIRILVRTLNSIKNQGLPGKQIHVIIAQEKKEDLKNRREKQKELNRLFGNAFGGLHFTLHTLLPGEIAGKASNERYAALWLKRNFVDTGKIDRNYLIITSCDADHTYHPNHFSCLTYKFLDNPKRYLTFWQAAIMFYNNIWEIPAITRVPNTLGSIWNLSQLPRRDRLINQQNYSLSFNLLDRAGYWDPDKIPEDWGIFFKAFYATKGQVEVEPLYLPLMVDAAQSTGFFKTLKNQYEQYKRWAWGVSDDPWIIKHYLTSADVPFINKTMRLIQVLWSHFLWPVNWFMITIGLSLPVLLNPRFAKTTLGYRVPQFSSYVLTIALMFLSVTLIFDYIYKPKRPRHFPKWRAILMPLEFLLMPVAGFFFSALPGLDAHTRLMLGKYLEYRVTEKV